MNSPSCDERKGSPRRLLRGVERRAALSVRRLLISSAGAIALILSASWAEARTARSHSARCAFLASHGYPDCRTPKGMVVDHVKPLACGGPDTSGNMQL